MGLKSNDKCPYETEKEKIQPSQENHLRIEAEFEIKQPQAQGHLKPLEAEEAREGVSIEASGRVRPR